jgi:hypothetical protein
VAAGYHSEAGHPSTHHLERLVCIRDFSHASTNTLPPSGESHYIGPLPRPGTNAIPQGADYVSSHPHDGWLASLPYLIAQYKDTTPPAIPEHITIYHRLNPSDSGNSGGTLGNPPNRGMPQFPPGTCSQDRVFIDVFTSADGNVVADVNGHISLDTKVSAGMNHSSIPFDGWPGVPTVSLLRDGQNVTMVVGGRIDAPGNGVINWNAFVASSSA